MGIKNKPPDMGRPTDYDPKYIHLIRHLRKEGRDISAFCSAVGVSRKTYFNWKNKYPEFAEACEVAAEDSKTFLNDLLLQKAKGEGRNIDSGAVVAVYDRQHGSVRHSDETVKTEINIANMNVLSTLTDSQLEALAEQKYALLKNQGKVERIDDDSNRDES